MFFDVTCKQQHRAALNPFLNGTKNGDIGGTCKQNLNLLNAYLYQKNAAAFQIG